MVQISDREFSLIIYIEHIFDQMTKLAISGREITMGVVAFRIIWTQHNAVIVSNCKFNDDNSNQNETKYSIYDTSASNSGMGSS